MASRKTIFETQIKNFSVFTQLVAQALVSLRSFIFQQNFHSALNFAHFSCSIFSRFMLGSFFLFVIKKFWTLVGREAAGRESSLKY